MIRKLCSILVIVIITISVTLIIHPIMSVNAAMNRLCEADTQISNQKLNIISNMASVVLMQINDSHSSSDPNYATTQLKMANQSLGSLIKSLDILDQDHTIAGTIEQLNHARDLINDNKPIEAAKIIKDAKMTVYQEAYQCPVN
jgi:hypothetical protein